MTATLIQSPDRVLLSNISWQTYQSLVKDFEQQPGVRLTYNEQAVWNQEQIDLTVDPPPDLAIEIDITSSSINRLQIYADLRVPEIWRYNGQSLVMYRLENQEYLTCDRSLAFPFLTPPDIERFLMLKKTTKENALIRLFREWVRKQKDKFL